MPLTVRLDSDTEHCLDDLLAATGQDKSSLIRQLIRERWQQQQPRPSITQQLGGHPAAFLDTLPPLSAERRQRRRLLDQHLQARREVQHCRQGSGTEPGTAAKTNLNRLMIPMRFLMPSRLTRSAWTVGAIAMVTALLLEWGLIVADTASVS